MTHEAEKKPRKGALNKSKRSAWKTTGAVLIERTRSDFKKPIGQLGPAPAKKIRWITESPALNRFFIACPR